MFADFCRAAGMAVQREVVVPEWAKRRFDGGVVDAAIDLHAIAPAEGLGVLADAASRCPLAM
eukprot:11214683-Lingulodinium_polyedra.AAC.1